MNMRAAALSEFCLVLPIVLLIVLFFADAGCYLAARTSMEFSSSQALKLAQIIPGLEDDLDRGFENRRNFFQVQAVEARALEILNLIKAANPLLTLRPSAFLHEQRAALILPPPKPTLKAALNRAPMELKISAVYKSWLPFFHDRTISVAERAFRAPLVIADMPPLLDCRGDELRKFKFEKTRCQGARRNT